MSRTLRPGAGSMRANQEKAALKPGYGSCDPLVGRLQRKSHMLGAARAVELAGSHQDAALGEPRQTVAARLAAGGPQIQPGFGVLDGESRIADRGQQGC